jgi:hypothetical protein
MGINLPHLTPQSSHVRSCVSLFYTKTTMAATLQVKFLSVEWNPKMFDILRAFLQIDKDYADAYIKSPSLLMNILAAVLGLKIDRITVSVRAAFRCVEPTSSVCQFDAETLQAQVGDSLSARCSRASPESRHVPQVAYTSSGTADSLSRLKALVFPVNSLAKFGVVAATIDGMTVSCGRCRFASVRSLL